MSGFGYNVLGFGANASSAAILPSDDQFNRVSALFHMEGSNNGVNNAFDDGSSSNHTITARDNATQGSFGPFARPDGEWGWSFDGNDYLSIPDSGDFELASGDFTVAAWLFPHVDGSTYQPVITHASHSGNAGWGIWYQANKLQFFVNNASTTVYITSGTFTANEWTHVAAVRTGNTIKLFINGDEDVSTSISDFTNSTTTLTIGASPNWNSTYYYTGIISNILVLKGTALYTGDFTPPTSKYTAITNTSLLTCQSNRFVDNSASGHVITLSNNPAVSAFGPFLTSSVYDPAVNGASGYFDGTDDLTIPNSSDFNLSNNPFTFSFWANFSDGGTLYGRYNYPSSQRETFIATEDDGTIRMRISSNGTGYSDHATSSGVFVFNQWNYIVITRTISGSDSVFKTYVNGTLSKTTTINITTIYNASQATYIMNYGPIADRPTGYLCDFKLVNGTATAPNSSNPTAPATNTTNTKLLLNMADGQAIDSAAQNNLTLYGNAKISTGQAKFGDTSLLLDETGDYVTLPNNSFKPFGTGNFTIECFARFATSTVGNGQGLFQLSSGYLNSAVRGPAAGANNEDGKWAIYHGTTFLVHGSLVPSQNTWYHVAYVRNSGVTKLYIDGTEILSVNDTTDYTDKYFVVGGWYSTSYLLNGYIDEFRISHMARYTSNFTAPTAAFADKGQ